MWIVTIQKKKKKKCGTVYKFCSYIFRWPENQMNNVGPDLAVLRSSLIWISTVSIAIPLCFNILDQNATYPWAEHGNRSGGTVKIFPNVNFLCWCGNHRRQFFLVSWFPLLLNSYKEQINIISLHLYEVWL